MKTPSDEPFSLVGFSAKSVAFFVYRHPRLNSPWEIRFFSENLKVFTLGQFASCETSYGRFLSGYVLEGDALVLYVANDNARSAIHVFENTVTNVGWSEEKGLVICYNPMSCWDITDGIPTHAFSPSTELSLDDRYSLLAQEMDMFEDGVLDPGAEWVQFVKMRREIQMVLNGHGVGSEASLTKDLDAMRKVFYEMLKKYQYRLKKS
jgi:hypothetical protein